MRNGGKAVDDGYNYVILSDRGVDVEHAPIPSLLALSAVHHYLNDRRKRAQIALIVETAEAREVMHMALLIGFGASIKSIRIWLSPCSTGWLPKAIFS